MAFASASDGLYHDGLAGRRDQTLIFQHLQYAASHFTRATHQA